MSVEDWPKGLFSLCRGRKSVQEFAGSLFDLASAAVKAPKEDVPPYQAGPSTPTEPAQSPVQSAGELLVPVQMPEQRAHGRLSHLATDWRIVVRPGSIHCRRNIVTANRLRSLGMLSPALRAARTGLTTITRTSSSTSWWAWNPCWGPPSRFITRRCVLCAYFIPYPIELLHKSNCGQWRCGCSDGGRNSLHF